MAKLQKPESNGYVNHTVNAHFRARLMDKNYPGRVRREARRHHGHFGLFGGLGGGYHHRPHHGRPHHRPHYRPHYGARPGIGLTYNPYYGFGINFGYPGYY